MPPRIMKDTTAFTTGAHIQPLYVPQLGYYVWVVSEFEDSTFIDGSEVNVQEVGEALSDLVIPDEEEDYDTDTE